MALSAQRLLIAVICLIELFGLPKASAQRGQGGGGGPMYDLTKEASFTGTVDAVEIVTPPGRGRRSLGGTHLQFKTGSETLEVHLGPTAFLKGQQAEFAKGDALVILGSRVVIEGEPVVLAKQITRDGRTWTLRDASGRPLWAGGGGPR